MEAGVLKFEKETLLRIAGPELYLQTGLEPLATASLEEINGGSIIGAIVSAVVSGVVSGVASATATSFPSGVASAVGSAVASAVVGFVVGP